MGRDNSMSKKEKEEAPEVWTEKWGVKIREPQEMPTTMAKFCIETVDKAFEAHPDFDKDGSVISAEIRKGLEDKYDPCWQVVLGRNFGSSVTYQSNHFLNFYKGQVNVLIMKTVRQKTTFPFNNKCVRITAKA